MSDQTRSSGSSWAVWLLALIGVLLVVVAVIYLARPASSLPGFFPGHDASLSRHHNRSGLAALGLAVIAFAGAAWLLVRSRTSD